MLLLRDGDCSVHMIGGGGMGVSHPTDAHIYLINGATESALIDAGSGIQPELMWQNIIDDDIPPESIKQLLLTHSHWDHGRGCAWWQSKTKLEIHGHPLACQVVEQAEWSHSHVAQQGIASEAAKTHRRLQDEEHIRVGKLAVQTLYTPGHSEDSVSYLLQLGKKSVLFSGDTVFAEGCHGTVSAQTDFKQFLSSVTRLDNLRIDALLPSHKQFVLSRAHAHVSLLRKNMASTWTSMNPSRVPFFPTWWLEHDESLYDEARLSAQVR